MGNVQSKEKLRDVNFDRSENKTVKFLGKVISPPRKGGKRTFLDVEHNDQEIQVLAGYRVHVNEGDTVEVSGLVEQDEITGELEIHNAIVNVVEDELSEEEEEVPKKRKNKRK